ncbi:MAG TPA: SGNH/GDSL hydrolase family protein [Micromonosporaceae bacterium]|nr:SGNH/GDSL hydrolase family protein [Micromonosporaceae bacterium]
MTEEIGSPLVAAADAEATDPYCLRPGEAAALLAGHPWRRFAALGDSVAEGVGEPVPGYRRLGWVGRVAEALAVHRADLAYLNLGARDLRAAQVRERQLAAALAFAPDLALIACGANDALRPRYDPDRVRREVTAMVRALQEHGAEVLTVSLFVLSSYPHSRHGLRPPLAGRLRRLAGDTRALAAELGTIHIALDGHPAETDPSLYSGDGIHGNDRSHAIAAAEAVRRLGAHLGNRWP